MATVKERKRVYVPHTWNDGALKYMSNLGFKASGWDRYKDSPYAEYKRRVEDVRRDKNNT